MFIFEYGVLENLSKSLGFGLLDLFCAEVIVNCIGN